MVQCLLCIGELGLGQARWKLIIERESLLCSVCHVQNTHSSILVKQMKFAENNRCAIALWKSCLRLADVCSSVTRTTDSFYKALWESLTRAISIEFLSSEDVQTCLRSIQDDNYVIHAPILEYSSLPSPKILCPFHTLVNL